MMEFKTQGSETVRRLGTLAQDHPRSHRSIKADDVMNVIITEGEYNGYPTLTFDGPFRRFTLGMKKLRALKQAWPEVESFLERHSRGKSGLKSKYIHRRHPGDSSHSHQRSQDKSTQGFTDEDDIKI